jgi:hypothetical protein
MPCASQLQIKRDIYDATTVQWVKASRYTAFPPPHGATAELAIVAQSNGPEVGKLDLVFCVDQTGRSSRCRFVPLPARPEILRTAVWAGK